VWLAVSAALLAFTEVFCLKYHYTELSGVYSIIRGLAGFGLGANLFAIARRIKPASRHIHSLIELCCLATITICLWQGWVPIVALAGGCLIVMFYYDAGVVSRALHNKVWVWLGHISFSMYLCHVPLLFVIGKVIAPWRLPLPSPWSDLLFITAALASLFAVSTLTWGFIEEPGRRMGSRLAKRSK
jgi:peptidoglycan/LPS O-acetylase OafA/YrhL